MKAAFQILKTVAFALLRFGIAYGLLLFVANFTVVQSVVLALVALCAIDAYRLAVRVAEKQTPKFEPFWVWIEPNWELFSKDFGLADVEKWDELLKRCGSSASSGYSVFHSGVTFTMLSPTLFYSNDYQTFFGELDIARPVEELKSEPDDRGRQFAPEFCIKRSVAVGKKRNLPVIEFSLFSEESRRKRKSLYEADANIVVAQLPEIVFHYYFDGEYNSEYDVERIEAIEKESKLRLAEFGWTEKEHRLHRPFEINHKYLRVTCEGIS